jgi:hypothetical protein
MQYIARLVVIFPEGSTDRNVFDAWNAIVMLEAADTRTPLRSVAAKARSVFDDPGKRKVLGYSTKPMLYVVSSLSRRHDLRSQKISNCEGGILITDMMSLTDQNVQKLRAKHDISAPLRALYVVEP